MPETEAGADNLHYVDRACGLLRENRVEEFDTLTNEIRDEISKTIILNDETWEGLRCRICPSCATAIPTCFCVCLECGAQLFSTGRFCIHIGSDDEGDDHKPNVSGDARRAQDEANDNAAEQMGRKTNPKMMTWTRKDTHLVTGLKRKTVVGSTATMTWHRGLSLIPSGWRSAWASHERLNTWRDSSHCRCQRCGGCSRVGKSMTEIDHEGILMPSTEQKVTQSQNVRARTFRTIEERNQHIRYLVSKCEGLCIF